MLKKIIPNILVIVSTAFALIMNLLAIALPLNGVTTQQVADNFPVYFAPAGYVFAIWGLIYAGLIVFSIYQILPRGRADERLAKLRRAVVVANVLNGVWIIWWHYGLLPLSTLTIILLLATLIYIYLHLPAWKERVGKVFRYTTQLVFSVYLGWIVVAATSNVLIQLYDANWTGLGIANEYWAALLCLVTADIAINLVWVRRDYPFALVIIWAIFGIYMKFADVPALAITALISSGLVAIAILVALYRQLLRRLRKEAPVPTPSEQPAPEA